MKRTFNFVRAATFALLAVCFAAALVSCGYRGDVTIVYTNDVHAHINNNGKSGNLSYGTVAAIKEDLIAQGKAVALVDAGDFAQGTAYASMDQGASVMKFMNAAGYDLAALGNHEFDYGFDRLFGIVKEAAFPIVSCNLIDVKGKPLDVAPYKVLKLGKTRVAFVGGLTPETYSKAAPQKFLAEDGKSFLYEIADGQDGSQLYSCIQKTVDRAARHSDYVVVLGHLGVDAGSAPWRSEDVIAKTHGIDVFIDGHSHTVMEERFVKNDKGQDVLLTQTGCYFGAIGLLELSDKKSSSRLIKEYNRSDKKVDDMVAAWIAQVDQQMGTKIAACAFPLCSNRPDQNHERLVRKQETNLGDFATDAFYYYLNNDIGVNCDAALCNGGGLRTDIPAGEITFTSLKNVMPFGNDICLVELTGRQIFDALEFGARYVGSAENGGFMHVAGLRFKIDSTIPSAVQTNAEKFWLSNPGPYRVSDVQVYDKDGGEWKPLDFEKMYSVAGATFFLQEKGDGFDMFEGAKKVMDSSIEDFMVCAEYAKKFKAGANGQPEISSKNSPMASWKNYLLDYENPNGSGRIVIK